MSVLVMYSCAHVCVCVSLWGCVSLPLSKARHVLTLMEYNRSLYILSKILWTSATGRELYYAGPVGLATLDSMLLRMQVQVSFLKTKDLPETGAEREAQTQQTFRMTRGS